MAKKKSNPSWFWFRNLLLLVVLSGVVYLLLFRPSTFQFDSTQRNPAAEGFTSFYERIRGTLADLELSDFVISLPDTSGRLTQQLEQRSRQVTPLAENWQGQHRDRRFRAGDTVKTKLEEYSQAEGLELYWTLPRDYVVKHYFQTDGSLTAAVKEIAAAIAPNFPSPILSYLCPNERALVITDQPNSYLHQNCQRL